jgi:hypothetical protein
MLLFFASLEIPKTGCALPCETTHVPPGSLASPAAFFFDTSSRLFMPIDLHYPGRIDLRPQPSEYSPANRNRSIHRTAISGSDPPKSAGSFPAFGPSRFAPEKRSLCSLRRGRIGSVREVTPTFGVRERPGIGHEIAS